MRQYLDLLQDIVDNGVVKSDRTGTGTKSVFGRQVRYNLGDGFPAVTTKKLYFNSVVHELLWFLQGTGNIEYLAQNNVLGRNMRAYPRRIEYGGATIDFSDTGIRTVSNAGGRIAQILNMSDGLRNFCLRSFDNGGSWTLLSISQ